MTLTFKPDLNKVKLNKRAKYLGQMSLGSKAIVRTLRHTHTPAQLLDLEE